MSTDLRGLDIGLAYDLRSDFALDAGAPVDGLEEYDHEDTIERLESTLRRLGHRPRRLGGGRRFLQVLLSHPPQLVFTLAEGRGARGREAQVPAVCEMLGIPCTHADAATLALCLDKALAKTICRAAGVRTPDSVLIAHEDELAALALPYPLFVKPLAEGSSMGVRDSSRVADAAALAREVRRCLRDYRQPVLVESFLPGAEITVGLAGPAQSPRVLQMMQIMPAQGAVEDFVYGLESKRGWQERVRYAAPPQSLSAAQLEDVRATAMAAYRALACRDVARLDLRLDAQGRAHFIEANPLPGLGATSDLVLMLEWSGGSYEELVRVVLHEALLRLHAAACTPG